MLINDDDLISLFTIIPNIHCLHVSLRQIRTFESPLWSSIVLSYLVEFYLWAELAYCWTMDELIILLRIMPALQRLSLNFATYDVRLLDAEQVRSLLSSVNISHLNKFHYAVEYCGASLEYSIIFNLRQKWSPQPIAFTVDAECCNVFLYTIPFKFHRFWTRMLSPEAKKLSMEQKLPICYGEGAYITNCSSNIPAEFSDLYSVMQKTCHIEKLRLCFPNKTSKNAFG